MITQSSSSAKGAAGASPPSKAKGKGKGKGTPCCSKVGLKRGPWTPEEDKLLTDYINKEGEGRWRTLPKMAGLLRCGKSCRLRWMNYLRPTVKRGHITPDEEDLILRLHRLLGNRWSLIAGRIPGRTDNEIKNYWNTHLTKKLISQGIDPRNHKPLLVNPTDNPKNHTSSSSSSVPIIKPTPIHVGLSNQDKTVKIINSSVNVGGTTNNHQIDQPNSVGGTTNETTGNGGGDEDFNMDGCCGIGDDNEDNVGMDFCPDEDVFSTFFDSLMNDDVFFAAAHGQNNQQSNHDDITPLPLTSEHNNNNNNHQPSNPFQHMNFPFSTAGWVDDDDFLP